MSSEQVNNWYELGRLAADEMHLSPQRIPHLEARGFLCHELLYLFGGSHEFVETPKKQIVLRFLERRFPIAPICRWFPPDDSILEHLGRAPDYAANGAEVYRLTPADPPITVFFIESKPEKHPMGWFVPIFYNCPRLMLERFCRPPFEKGNDSNRYEMLLRRGATKRHWAPLVSEEDARDMRFTCEVQANRGVWEVLSRYPKKALGLISLSFRSDGRPPPILRLERSSNSKHVS